MFLKTYLQYAGVKAWISLVMTVFLSLTESISLVLLIPLMQLIGFNGGENSDWAASEIDSYTYEMSFCDGMVYDYMTLRCTFPGMNP